VTSTIRKRILLTVDGSDQALNAVRYVGEMMPSDRTDVVLFNVGTGFPEVFWDMNNNPLYQSKKSGVMGWLANSQLVMGEFREKAYKVLSDAGFSHAAISVKTEVRKIGVLKDIIQESYQGYSGIVVGRTGISRLKYLIFGSVAQKLAERVRHIPTVIVGGKPKSSKILIALDDSIEAMRGVISVAALAAKRDPEIILCHCLDQSCMPHADETVHHASQGEMDWIEYHKNRFKPVMDEASQRLLAAGVSLENVSRDFVLTKGNVIQKIIEIGLTGDFGTIVVGRRDAISFAHEHFRGRFGEKIIGSLDNMAVWVVS
jgi:nucleotide-binding universal stress UspA family protein